ncbi:hypothetical protein, partial [Methanothrix sp.]|uniref:hypothetical protein n=1 Tax=Methanothrix sp. TaxID=90426 RepID=UPI0023575F90
MTSSLFRSRIIKAKSRPKGVRDIEDPSNNMSGADRSSLDQPGLGKLRNMDNQGQHRVSLRRRVRKCCESSTGHATALNPDSKSKEDANDQADVNASQMDAASNETAKAPKEDAVPTEPVINEPEIKEPVVDLKGDWKVILNTVIDGQNTQEALDLILIQ